MTRHIIDSYPVGPLQRAVRYKLAASRMDGHELCRLIGFHESAVSRLLNRPADDMMTSFSADEWAIGIGLHPAVIWPEWFSDEKCQQAYRKEFPPARAPRPTPESVGVPQGECGVCGALKTQWNARAHRWYCVPCASRRKNESRQRQRELAHA